MRFIRRVLAFQRGIPGMEELFRIFKGGELIDTIENTHSIVVHMCKLSDLKKHTSWQRFETQSYYTTKTVGTTYAEYPDFVHFSETIPAQ